MLRSGTPVHHQSCKPRVRCDIRFKDEADSSADHLILEYQSLVKAIAWQVFAGLPYHASVELNDVMQAGHLGLVNASRSYRADLQVPFASYARHRIRGEILDSLRKLDMASRNLRNWQRRIEKSAKDLNVILSREPTDEEVSARMGVGVSRLRKKQLALWRVASCAPQVESERESSRDTAVAASEGMPDSLQQRRQLLEFVSKAVALLPMRSQQVIEYYYLQNLPMREIGRLLNVNESRISQIHKMALDRMARGLRASGIRSARDLLYQRN